MTAPTGIAGGTAAGTILRPIGPFDLDVAAALHAACFDDAWSAASIAAVLATPGSFGLLSITSNTPSGFLLARVAADEAEILSLGVLPVWRRHGVARQLLAAAELHAAESGARRLFLEVAADNSAARALYLRAGFAQVGRRPCYYRRGAAGIHALILARTLSNASEAPSAAGTS